MSRKLPSFDSTRYFAGAYLKNVAFKNTLNNILLYIQGCSLYVKVPYLSKYKV